MKKRVSLFKSFSKAQSVIEYLLMLTVLCLVIIAAFGPEDTPMKRALRRFYNTSAEIIENEMDSFVNSP